MTRSSRIFNLYRAVVGDGSPYGARHAGRFIGFDPGAWGSLCVLGPAAAVAFFDGFSAWLEMAGPDFWRYTPGIMFFAVEGQFLNKKCLLDEGRLLGAAEILGEHCESISPRAWQGMIFGDKVPQGKDARYRAVVEALPEEVALKIEAPGRKQMRDGRADAFCLAICAHMLYSRSMPASDQQGESFEEE